MPAPPKKNPRRRLPNMQFGPRENEARWRPKVAKKLLRLLIVHHGEEKCMLK